MLEIDLRLILTINLIRYSLSATNVLLMREYSKVGISKIKSSIRFTNERIQKVGISKIKSSIRFTNERIQ